MVLTVKSKLSVTMNVALFGNGVLADDQVQMSSLGWALIQYDRVLIKRVNLDTAKTDMYRGKMMRRHGEITLSPSQGVPEAIRSWERGLELLFPPSAQKEQTVLLTP